MRYELAKACHLICVFNKSIKFWNHVAILRGKQKVGEGALKKEEKDRNPIAYNL